MSNSPHINKTLDKVWRDMKQSKTVNVSPYLKMLCFVIVLLLTFYSFDSQAATCADTNFTLANCPLNTGIVLDAVEYAVLTERASLMNGIEEITPESIAISFTWGFGTYLSFWWLSYVIKVAKRAIKIM